MVITGATRIERVRSLLDHVVDPDMPFLTITDIAILREVTIEDGGAVTVRITPTYSGCPAMGTITSDIHSVLAEGGFDDVVVETVYNPAWTTEWMSEEAKRKLAENRIAPPDSVLSVVPEILCPMCKSDEIDTVSEFGSTACKSLMVCTHCGEPFDSFKAI
ncbi:MAG: phenylacetate-CoA oxygenase subunit PaaJ [Acidimicrobiia bacterium]|nr:MAG: phenylacetate-CoA oxygenase subunit PaaJ [Acidimicrobiia bacterium]